MANYTPQKPGHTEAAFTIRTPAGDGLTDTFDNDGCTMLRLINTGSSHTCTIEATATCNYGFTHDLSVTVPGTTGDVQVGPFPTDRFGTTTTITWGASVTGLTFCLTSTAGTVTGVA